jgi:hypothetical protein
MHSNWISVLWVNLSGNSIHTSLDVAALRMKHSCEKNDENCSFDLIGFVRRRNRTQMTCVELAQGCQMVHFQTKNSQFEFILECLAIKDVGKFYDHLVISLPFCIFYGHFEYFVVVLVYFYSFGMLHREKSGNPELVHRFSFVFFSCKLKPFSFFFFEFDLGSVSISKVCVKTNTYVCSEQSSNATRQTTADKSR